MGTSDRAVLPHVESWGDPSNPPMLFVHPNPLDSSCWHYQVADFGDRYRIVAIDLPGYGQSPPLPPVDGLRGLAELCWEAVDGVPATRPFVVVGCSVGSIMAKYLYHTRPAAVRGLVLSGTGYTPDKAFVERRVSALRREGLAYRHEFVLSVLSPAFRDTPMAAWYADLWTRRNPTTDLESIIQMFLMLGEPDPEWLHRDIAVPTLVISGTEDALHAVAGDLAARIPHAEHRAIHGAGHAAHLEQPWVYNRMVSEFLDRVSF